MSDPAPPKGTCFPDSLNRFLHGMPLRGSVLVHGEVDGGDAGRIGHAWLENEDVVWDPQLGYFERDEFYSRFKPALHARYGKEEAELAWLRAGHYGPWHEAPKPEI